jgi:hypothetical protein
LGLRPAGPAGVVEERPAHDPGARELPAFNGDTPPIAAQNLGDCVRSPDRFPYRVFGSQQESGSAEVWSRGNDGAITFREFHPVGVEEYGYVAPDPLHPWLIYGGKVTVYDERTGQTRDVSPTYDDETYRFDRTNPLVFNRVDKRTLPVSPRRWRISRPTIRSPGNIAASFLASHRRTSSAGCCGRERTTDWRVVNARRRSAPTQLVRLCHKYNK